MFIYQWIHNIYYGEYTNIVVVLFLDKKRLNTLDVPVNNCQTEEKNYYHLSGVEDIKHFSNLSYLKNKG